MSSATSTKGPDASARPALTPGQFFLLAALGCATAVSVMVRGQGVTTIILLSILIASTALVGIAALRTLNPLVTDQDDRTEIIGGRTRAALEREKLLSLRAIKELEFDRAMGKLSESDFHEMSTRLRARAARIIRQLDAGEGYRAAIERDLEKRLGEGSVNHLRQGHGGPPKPSAEAEASPSAEREGSATALAERPCSCGTVNDHDARFCKACGSQL
jgi:hypothetical protein